MAMIDTSKKLFKQFKKLAIEIESQIGSATADDLKKLMETQQILVETMNR